MGVENVFVFRPKAERDAMKKAATGGGNVTEGGGGKGGGGGGPGGAIKTNNPNHAKKGSSGVKVKDLSVDDEPADPLAGIYIYIYIYT